MEVSFNRRSLTVGVLLALGFTWFLWSSASAPAPGSHQDSEPVKKELRVHVPMLRHAGIQENDDQLWVEASTVNWNACIDRIEDSDCLDEVTKLVAEVAVLGDLSVTDLIDRLEGNKLIVHAVANNAECEPRPFGLQRDGALLSTDAVAEPSIEDCGASAFAEVGALIARCRRAVNDEDGSLRRTGGLVREAERNGVTDLQRLYELEQADRYDQLEYAWLNRECEEELLESLSNLPSLYKEIQAFDVSWDVIGPHNSHAFWPEDYPWKTLAIGDFYIERAILLGDYRAAHLYYDAARRMAESRIQTPKEGHPYTAWYVGEEEYEAPVRAYDAAIQQNIEKIIAADPAVGYELLAEHLVKQFPSFDYYFDAKQDEQFEAELAIEKAELIRQDPSIEAVIRAHEASQRKTYTPKTNWHERALDMVTYQLVSNRLRQIPEDLHFSKLGGKGFAVMLESRMDEFVGVNDWEYASQRANRIIAALDNEPGP